jgi:hypothetical protein
MPEVGPRSTNPLNSYISIAGVRVPGVTVPILVHVFLILGQPLFALASLTLISERERELNFVVLYGESIPMISTFWVQVKEEQRGTPAQSLRMYNVTSYVPGLDVHLYVISVPAI